MDAGRKKVISTTKDCERNCDCLYLPIHVDKTEISSIPKHASKYQYKSWFTKNNRKYFYM